MKLYLPDKAWLIRLNGDPDPEELEDEDGPFRRDWEDNLLDAEGYLLPHFLMDDRFKLGRVRKGCLQEAREVWWLHKEQIDCPNPKKMSGRYFSQCMGSGIVYDTRDAALGDLAKCSEPVGWLWALATTGTGPAQRLAR